MKRDKIPNSDSINELAAFWQTHDLADYEDVLEVVPGPVFVRGKTVRVVLKKSEEVAVLKLAKKKGISSEELVRTWVRDGISSRAKKTKKATSRV